MGAKSRKKAVKSEVRARETAAPRTVELRPVVVVALLLVAVTLAAYLGVLGNGFVYDDTEYVTRNPVVQMGLRQQAAAWAFEDQIQPALETIFDALHTPLQAEWLS